MSVGDGLPGTDIQEIAETPDGYLWLATSEGLIRFDGMRFESFFHVPSGARYGTRIGALELDERGRMWIGADQDGVVYRDGNTFKEALTNGKVLEARVVSLCHDPANRTMLWVDGNGASGRFSPDDPSVAERFKGGSTSVNSHWIRDHSGTIWLVNTRTLKRREKGKWRDYHIPGTALLIAAPRRAGGLWIARDAKLRSVNREGAVLDHVVFPWKGQTRVTCLFEDRRNRLWIGTAGQGVYCFDKGEFQQVVSNASTPSCVTEDSHGNIWVGTRGGGLISVREKQFFLQDPSSGLANEYVRGLTQDKQGRIWLSTGERGLGWWQDGTWHEVSTSPDWPGHESLSVVPALDSGVWISTTYRGLWRWKEGDFSKIDLGRNGPTEPAADLHEDRLRRVWMVTDNAGIYCLSNKHVFHYTVADGLQSVRMRRLIEDETGNIWAGDWEGGISKFENGKWKRVRAGTGHRDAVRTILSANGALWVGTSAGGILRIKDGKTSRLGIDEGLPDVCIQQMLLDVDDSLWCSSSHKLFRLSLSQLDGVADGKRSKVDAITYGRGDGLPDLTFANWCDPRTWRTTDGELWFATANGALHFRPDKLRTTPPPNVLIEDSLLDGKPINIRELQKLRPGPGRLEFRFTAPCLVAPERVRFRYQLTGVDTDWVEAGPTRTATYASIPAGQHEFRVVASSPDGIWGKHVASIGFAVHPFFWQTNWFLASVAAALAGSGVWIVRRKTVRRLARRLEHLRQEQALDRERARIAQDIHDELGANLTSIGLLADMGTRHKTDPLAVSRELEQISLTARESVAAMDAIVWALNPRNDSLDHFANYLTQFTRDFFRPTKLRTRFDLPANLPAQPLPMETRHQLFLIVKECFNNIVRHAEATEVNLELACDERELRLSISDNGKGLSEKTKREGADGLVNLRDRIGRLGGSLSIKSSAAEGTRLNFTLPLTPNKQS